MCLSGTLSLYYGIERMYDTRNYHIYAPWAFLTSRIGKDLMPAGIQSYFNPILDIPYFLAIKYLNNYPACITFCMGFSYALFLFMIYKISFLIFKDFSCKLFPFLCVVTAAGIELVLRCLGWHSHDLFLADLFLISIYILFRSFGKKSFASLFWAGILSGACVGFKYTSIIFAIPLGLSLLFFSKQFIFPLKSFIYFCLGNCVGFFLSDGYWMYKLYKTFSNPFFPYFNWLFKSPLIKLPDVFNSDFSSLSFKSPNKFFSFLKNQSDVRLKILGGIFFINLFMIPFVNKEDFKKIFKINIRYCDFILFFLFGSYILWGFLFGTPRYYAPILGFIGIVCIIIYLKIVYLIKKIFPRIFLKNLAEKRKNLLVILPIFLCLLILLFPNFQKSKEKKLIRIPVNDKLLWVQDISLPDNAVVFVSEGCGIVLPFQNPNVSYLKINPFIFSKTGQMLFSDEVLLEVKKKIDPEKTYLISSYDYSEMNIKNQKIQNYDNLKHKENLSLKESVIFELKKFDLEIADPCKEIETNMHDKYSGQKHAYYICQLSKTNEEK